MKLCRFRTPSGVSFGALKEDRLYNLTAVDPKVFRNMNSAYSAAQGELSAMTSMTQAALAKAPSVAYDESVLEIPVDEMEIWAAGVTYLRSREARETETKSKGIYDYVYSAVRPELFIKDTGLRCRGPNQEVCVRGDSKWSVPEPELTVVFDGQARVVGYTVGNDVSSRDIEGENPLYLPQAKVYTGSSAVGPVVVTADEITDPHALRISMRILRGGAVYFQGSVSTSQMKRTVGELAAFLKKDNDLRTFTLLMTGTSIVPPDSFTLSEGDVVEIEIEGIGLLRNAVRKLG